jgi:hypothetical protein
LRTTLVAGTAMSETVASAAASSFFVFDIRVTSLRFEPLRTRLRASGGSLTANYGGANERLTSFQFMRATLRRRRTHAIGAVSATGSAETLGLRYVRADLPMEQPLKQA